MNEIDVQDFTVTVCVYVRATRYFIFQPCGIKAERTLFCTESVSKNHIEKLGLVVYLQPEPSKVTFFPNYVG